MQLIYEGTDITDYVDVVRSVHRDAAGGRMDSLEIEFENKGRWYAWGPKKDDTIELINGGYTTGTLYVDMILPEERRFRIIANSAPGAAQRRAWGSFEHATLGAIMRACAAECGMEWGVYGLDESTTYTYLLRKNEKCTGFLRRLLALEGALLKCYSRKLTAVSIQCAQELPAGQTIQILNDTPGVAHKVIEGRKIAGLDVVSPLARGSASDSAANAVLWERETEAPATDDIQAARWARGLLLTRNRQAEMLEVQTGANPGMTAMARVDVYGAEATAGAWIVDEAEHDFVKKSTKARLVRCVASIR